MSKKFTLGIVGVRGYVGRELLALLANSKHIQIDWVSSRQLEGKPLSHLVSNSDSNSVIDNEDFIAPEIEEDHYYKNLKIENLSTSDIANKKTDVVVLALPNGLAQPFVDAIEQTGETKIIIDLSADYRFDDQWIYSVPELLSADKINDIGKQKLIKISNPGCYATAMQVGLAPLVEHIKQPAHCFGISGYSGAGTTPSKNNDPKNLNNNILPYALLEHIHEKEVAYQLNCELSFSPHVAAFFRGINMTFQLELNQRWTIEKLQQHFEDFYQQSALIKVSSEVPNIQQVINTNDCLVGGFKLSQNGKRCSFVSCLDNLLKGAASQALQNIYLALGLELSLKSN